MLKMLELRCLTVRRKSELLCLCGNVSIGTYPIKVILYLLLIEWRAPRDGVPSGGGVAAC
jgi:hypothetical protein